MPSQPRDRIYQRTPSGDEALASHDLTLPADTAHDLDFSTLPAARHRGPERSVHDDLLRTRTQAQAAATALGRKGAFLSPDRLRHRAPLDKKPAEITVLVVEDDPDQAALANLRMSMVGYGVRLARNCRELVHEIRTAPRADLVLLDIMLPDGNVTKLYSKKILTATTRAVLKHP